jgi:high-affinity iron transporter
VVATFLIFLREGIEASMIIAILCAYLDKIGQRRHFRDVFLGVAAAMVLVLAGGVAVYLTLKTYAGSTTQIIFETCTYVVAAVMLTYMTFWMRNHSRTLSSHLRQRAEAAMDGQARFGLGVLAFQAVGREGLETMVFTLAIVFATSTRGVLAGGVSLAIAAAIYRFGKRINIVAFFKTVGALLMIFAAGLIADAVENMQQLGWIHFLNGVVWNSSGVLSENSTLGDILHTFFGYADRPTVLQLICYFVYLVVAVTAFLRVGPPTSGSTPAAASPAANGGELAPAPTTEGAPSVRISGR